MERDGERFTSTYLSMWDIKVYVLHPEYPFLLFFVWRGFRKILALLLLTIRLLSFALANFLRRRAIPYESCSSYTNGDR